ncbi:MAG: hypothetical protein IJ452_02470, partial [Butyricicoccus sp.]|nr:hypothetical protein [Butyricicoccus sp.]
ADERHRLEFLRALVRGSPLIVFNTPLKRAELVANEPAFKALLDYACKCSVGIVMMFNNVDRLMRLCDHAVIVRDGHTVCLCEKQEFNRTHLLQLLDIVHPASTPVPPTVTPRESALELHNLYSADGNLKGLSLTADKGEITGVICRDDEWNGWFAETLQGLHSLTIGEIRRNGIPCTQELLRRTCTKENRAFFIIGSDHLGLLQHMTALDNLLLPIQSRAGGLLGTVGKDLTTHLLQLCIENGILSSPEEAAIPVGAMSIEKKLKIWTVRAQLFHPDLCVFLGLQEENHPQQRELIHKLARDLAQEGAGVLMLSTQKFPISEIANKLYYVEDGRIISSTK